MAEAPPPPPLLLIHIGRPPSPGSFLDKAPQEPPPHKKGRTLADEALYYSTIYPNPLHGILSLRGWVPLSLKLRATQNLEGAADAGRLRRRAPTAG